MTADNLHPTQRTHYDIIIAGGGMVGVSLACALAKVDKGNVLSVLLVDSFPDKRLASHDDSQGPVYHPSFDARSTALSLASIETYESMGLLPALLQHASPIRQVHVSDRGHMGSTLLDANAQSKNAFGYVIENQWLGEVLLNHLATLPAIERITGANVGNIIPKQDGVSVDITSGADTEDQRSSHGLSSSEPSTLTASLLIVADGAQSGLRDSLGITASVKRYDQRAVIAIVQTQLPHNGQAFERFVADGAVAFLHLIDLPNSKNRSALVWTMPTHIESDKDKTLLDDEAFIAELQKAFGHRLGTIQRIGQRQSYPLALTIADEVVRNHIVLMGNSAHSLHPVAGQGFNLSLRDIAALVERIGGAIEQQEDVGSLALLENYAEAQIKDQNLTIGFSHNLIELFGQQNLPVQLGRNLGLLALDLLGPAKNRFSDRAAGITGRKSLR
ncbi:MAG: 2-octaprenyl-6-methoxyphenyl hydroxylase [Sinobacterium sp.]